MDGFIHERANKASGSISASLVLSTGTTFPFVFTVSGKREYHQCLFMKFADLLLCASGNLSVSKLLLQILHQLQHLNQHFYRCGHSLQAAMKKIKTCPCRKYVSTHSCYEKMVIKLYIINVPASAYFLDVISFSKKTQ